MSGSLSAHRSGENQFPPQSTRNLSSIASFDRFKFYSGQHISIEYDLSRGDDGEKVSRFTFITGVSELRAPGTRSHYRFSDSMTHQ